MSSVVVSGMCAAFLISVFAQSAPSKRMNADAAVCAVWIAAVAICERARIAQVKALEDQHKQAALRMFGSTYAS